MSNRVLFGGLTAVAVAAVAGPASAQYFGRCPSCGTAPVAEYTVPRPPSPTFLPVPRHPSPGTVSVPHVSTISTVPAPRQPSPTVVSVPHRSTVSTVSVPHQSTISVAPMPPLLPITVARPVPTPACPTCPGAAFGTARFTPPAQTGGVLPADGPLGVGYGFR